MWRASSQRRRLALLALVAASGTGGISRDKVLAYLWPSTDDEHARHSLAQLLYAMRHALGRNLVEGDSQLRLDHASLTSDIGEFLDVPDDRLGIIQLYTGPFLDGFHLSDSIEFSHWVDRVRERTTAMACAALESLANEASGRGDHPLAIATWRARVGIDPLDAGPVMALMEALAASGDRAGAIRQEQAYQKMIRDELDMEADPRVTALANRFRRETPTSTPVVRAPPAASASVGLSDKSVDAAEAGAPDVRVPVAEAPAKKRRRGSALAAALALGVLGIVGALWRRGRGRKGTD